MPAHSMRMHRDGRGITMCTRPFCKKQQAPHPSHTYPTQAEAHHTDPVLTWPSRGSMECQVRSEDEPLASELSDVTGASVILVISEPAKPSRGQLAIHMKSRTDTHPQQREYLGRRPLSRACAATTSPHNKTCPFQARPFPVSTPAHQFGSIGDQACHNHTSKTTARGADMAQRRNDKNKHAPAFSITWAIHCHTVAPHEQCWHADSLTHFAFGLQHVANSDWALAN